MMARIDGSTDECNGLQATGMVDGMMSSRAAPAADGCEQTASRGNPARTFDATETQQATDADARDQATRGGWKMEVGIEVGRFNTRPRANNSRAPFESAL